MKLTHRVSLLIAAVVLVVGIATSPLLLHELRRASVEQFGTMASGVAEVLEGYIVSSASQGDGHPVRRAVDQLRGYPLLVGVAVYTSEGIPEASWSTDVGQAPAVDGRVREVLRTGKSITEANERDGVNWLDVVLPIANKPACQGCHGTDADLLGAVLVSLNTASQDSELRSQLAIVGLFGLVAFALTELTLFISLRQLVLDPLARLGQAAGRISAGDYTASVEVGRDDEVGVLAGALNQMAERVATQTADLRERGAQLEGEVSRRTRELRGLNGVIAAASSSLDLNEILSGALDRILETLEVEAGAIVIDGAGAASSAIARRGISPEQIRELRRPDLPSAENGRASDGESNGRSSPATSPRDLALPTAQSDGSLGRTVFATEVVVPIRSKGDALGDLLLASQRPAAISKQDESLLAAMADAVGVGVRNALVSTRLQRANREVRALLDRASAGGFDVRFDNPHLARCWVERQCTSTECPAYEAANLRCWQIAGTLCPTGQHGGLASGVTSCESCPVFVKGCGRDEISSIGESFNNLMFLLGSEARRREEMSNQFIERLMSAQEEERKRLARELHDETSQSLTSLLVGLKALEGTRTRREVKERVAQLEAQALGVLDEVHRLALELRPAALDELGLAAALRGYLKDTRRRVGVEIEFRADGVEPRLSPGLETALYRIVQESVTNAVRHGEARKIAVLLRRSPSAIEVTVKDDGVGFRASAPEVASRDGETGRGLGLLGMRERAALFQGSLTIESRPGSGTTVSAVIPLAAPPALEPAAAVPPEGRR